MSYQKFNLRDVEIKRSETCGTGKYTDGVFQVLWEGIWGYENYNF